MHALLGTELVRIRHEDLLREAAHHRRLHGARARSHVTGVRRIRRAWRHASGGTP